MHGLDEEREHIPAGVLVEVELEGLASPPHASEQPRVVALGGAREALEPRQVGEAHREAEGWSRAITCNQVQSSAIST